MGDLRAAGPAAAICHRNWWVSGLLLLATMLKYMDRLPFRWLYPAVVIGWSAAGMLTGLCGNLTGLLACRTLLGFFEAGHWPCALRTTQAVLSRKERTLGNSTLQSGGAFGAIITPLAIRAIVDDGLAPGAWRPGRPAYGSRRAGSASSGQG